MALKIRGAFSIVSCFSCLLGSFHYFLLPAIPTERRTKSKSHNSSREKLCQSLSELIRARRLHKRMRSWATGSSDRCPSSELLSPAGTFSENILADKQTIQGKDRGCISSISPYWLVFYMTKRRHNRLFFLQCLLSFLSGIKEVNTVIFTDQEVIETIEASDLDREKLPSNDFVNAFSDPIQVSDSSQVPLCYL